VAVVGSSSLALGQYTFTWRVNENFRRLAMRRGEQWTAVGSIQPTVALEGTVFAQGLTRRIVLPLFAALESGRAGLSCDESGCEVVEAEILFC